MDNAYDRCPTADEGSRGWRRGRKLSRIMSGNNFRETARGFLYFVGSIPAGVVYHQADKCTPKGVMRYKCGFAALDDIHATA